MPAKSTRMKVPFVDLSAQYHSIQSEIDGAIKRVIEETAFISGKYAQQFEKEFSQYCGLQHCIACANGTDSLEILLKAMSIGAGHEVLVPANSWISTSEAVSAVGARPVFVDIDENYLMNLTDAESKINASTKAIVPVHLYGNPVDMNAVMKLALQHGLEVMEDCAQSIGATIEGQKAGSFGRCSSYSFYPGKNLGAYGDAGAMVTNDEKLALLARTIANHGQQGKHNHITEGRNSRLDGIQGAILSAKLPYIEEWTNKRIAHAHLYEKLITNPSVVKPKERNGYRHVYHLYVIRVSNRNGLATFLKEKGIETAVHYPTPLPLLECYRKEGYTSSQFPVASKFQQEILSLPMYAELSEEQIQYVAENVNAWKE